MKKILLGLIIVGLIAGYFFPDLVSDYKVDAYLYAKDFVKEQLKAPTEAKFPSYPDSDINVMDAGKGDYIVRAFVDSPNDFGVKVREHFVAILHKSSDTWELKDLSFGETPVAAAAGLNAGSNDTTRKSETTGTMPAVAPKPPTTVTNEPPVTPKSDVEIQNDEKKAEALVMEKIFKNNPIFNAAASGKEVVNGVECYGVHVSNSESIKLGGNGNSGFFYVDLNTGSIYKSKNNVGMDDAGTWLEKAN